jgi:quercetin dioxygenase-like cupin family protein
MNSSKLTMIGAAVAMGGLGLVAAYAQSLNPFNGNVSNQYPNGIPAAAHATVKDPEGKMPDPSHIPVTLPKDVKWKVLIPNQGYIANIYGDPNKPGPYAVMYKWMPGAFSKPHFHDQVRHVVVVSGTWWVSSSSVYNEKLTYPLHAGTVATDEKNGIHWDGARTGEKEPAIIYLYGEGPVATVYVDTHGKPIPLAKKK